jgi:hypothetical protein
VIVGPTGVYFVLQRTVVVDVVVAVVVVVWGDALAIDLIPLVSVVVPILFVAKASHTELLL